MAKLVPPHGSETLMPLLLPEGERAAELERAKAMPQVKMTTRETSDLIMMGIGAFTPLTGFMGEADWKGACDPMVLTSGVFWPIPITLSADQATADSIELGTEVALVDGETDEIMGTMKVEEKYTIDKAFECEHVFTTTDSDHPGVQKVMEQADVNLGGPVKVVSEGEYPEKFAIYQRPEESRAIFEERGWSTVAALQLRNPMHASHAYLAWVAIEVCDGVYIHQLVGALKPGDIPAEVRVKCIDALVSNYFREERVVQGGFPMEMRYAGPREALLHAVFRQNFGCSHLIVGRDHAGVGNYYGPFDAHEIFSKVPDGALKLQPLKMDWTFYCYKCGSMSSMKTCPHGKEDRLMLSGTMLRKTLSEGGQIPAEFSKPEVLEILGDYYSNLEEKVEIKLHRGATGEG
jgi:sulfate adenylyltransferase